MPAEVKAALGDALVGCSVVKDGREPLDFAMVFRQTQGGVEEEEEFLRLQGAGAVGDVVDCLAERLRESRPT